MSYHPKACGSILTEKYLTEALVYCKGFTHKATRIHLDSRGIQDVIKMADFRSTPPVFAGHLGYIWDLGVCLDAKVNSGFVEFRGTGLTVCFKYDNKSYWLTGSVQTFPVSSICPCGIDRSRCDYH